MEVDVSSNPHVFVRCFLWEMHGSPGHSNIWSKKGEHGQEFLRDVSSMIPRQKWNTKALFGGEMMKCVAKEHGAHHFT